MKNGVCYQTGKNEYWKALFNYITNSAGKNPNLILYYILPNHLISCFHSKKLLHQKNLLD